MTEEEQAAVLSTFDADSLKQFRQKHRLTRARMGELLGVDENRIRSIERGAKPREEEAESFELIEPEQIEAVREQPPDELPDVPYRPSEPPDESEEPTEERPKAKAPVRRRGPQKRKLSGWQEETAQSLIALFRGETVTLEDGTVVNIPGLCHLLAAVEPTDAQIIYDGIPAFSVALVKVAPRHPFLKGLLGFATGAGDYQELFQASMAIMIPLAMHHGLVGPPPQIVAAPSNGGAQAEPEPPVQGPVAESPIYDMPREEPDGGSGETPAA